MAIEKFNQSDLLIDFFSMLFIRLLHFTVNSKIVRVSSSVFNNLTGAILNSTPVKLKCPLQKWTVKFE